jgi:hypothetical protein
MAHAAGALPPWQTVYRWFRRFVLLLFRTVPDIALMIDRERSGRVEPSAATLDSQTIRRPPLVAAVATMARRIASINDRPIAESERRYHWLLGHRPDDYPSLGDLDL